MNVAGLRKSLSSPIVEIAASSSAELSDVTDSASSAWEYSLSLLSVSDAVDGSYSCFSGEEDLLCRFKKAGVKEGNKPDFRPKEVDFPCVGVGGGLSSCFLGSSFVGVGLRF